MRWSWSISPALTILTALAALTLVASILGYAADERMVGGLSAWNKPAKFAISFLLWAPALVGIYSLVDRGRLLRGSLEILGWSMILELVLITMQAARGVASHFNYTTAFDGVVYTAMAAGVGTLTVVATIAGAILARRRIADTALGLSVKIAVPLMTVGAVFGYAMTRPFEGQLETAEVIGAHTVGGPDGGPGLPLLAWSTEFGDLRVAHFVGLHALQAIPLIALLLRRSLRRGRLSLTERHQRAIVWLAATAYAGLMVVTLWQALRGQSVIRPDALTLIVAAVAVGLPALATLPLLWRGRRRARRDRHRDGGLPSDTFAGIGRDDLAG